MGITAAQIISETVHFSDAQRRNLRKLLPQFEKITKLSDEQFNRVRLDLGTLKTDMHYKKFFQISAFITGVLFVIKKLREVKDDTDNHPVTDHAFCAAVRRLGYDMQALKDKALEEATAQGLKPVFKRGVILTFLPVAA